MRAGRERAARAAALGVVTAATAVGLAACTTTSGSGAPASAALTASGSPSTPTGPTTSASPPGSGGSQGATSTSPAPSSPTSPSGSGAGGPILCTPTVSRLSVEQMPGAAGHGGVRIHVVNGSAAPCVTTGYPGVAVLNMAGTQVLQAQRTPSGMFGGLRSGTPPTTTLAPGSEVTAILEWSNGINGGNCPEGVAVLFTLPDNTDSTRLAVRLLACPGGVQIHPLLPGTTGTVG